MLTPAENLIAEALFVSNLQPSEAPTGQAVRAAATEMILRYGSDGCAASTATEFGDHPEIAVRRMAWVRRLLPVAYPRLFGTGAPQLELAR